MTAPFLRVAPVLPGGAPPETGMGRRLRVPRGRVFPDDGGACPLELVSITTTTTGVVVCTYRRARD
jgi:hypothetical protein